MNEQFQIRLKRLLELKEAGRDPFVETKYEDCTKAKLLSEDFEAHEGQKFRLAGRIMRKRGMGKANFSDLQDASGHIQIYSRIDELGEEAYREWMKLDLGDLVGVEGVLMKTERGEISLRNQAFVLLAKSLRPLPEKFHGLQDTDTRYRRRYLDLIMNPEVREVFIKRSKIIRGIRDFLNERGFLEVETPLLNTIPGGAAARPFITHHNTLDLELYLRISPELYLKRLIVGGMERVYEIGRNFRNEGMSVRHNPEFTMMELYQAYANLYDVMDLTEMMIREVCESVNGSLDIEWEGNRLDLSKPFARVRMDEAVLQYAGVDFREIDTDEAAKKLADEHHIEYSAHHRRGDILNLFFEHYCEEKLIQPTFIYCYPLEISPLTKKDPEDPRMTERFELFVNGKELGNAYSELNDPLDQRERFMHQLELREAGDDEANLFDEDYCRALEYGLPPCGGLGIGIDRLCMMLTNSDSIRDVLFFPTMKPLDKKED
ncbi:MAG: lysine--tRNA ligase [Eubacteriales bacterium]|nr:lysine--tRNA ligase [Eubacteriales bacterium]